MKSYENEFKNHPPVQVPSLNILECPIWILTSRESWITVHHCAKRRKKSIIFGANLHSLPWNITSKADKIRTTLKRRWVFKRASGNRCLHDAGKTQPPRKAAAAAAAAAAILCHYIRGQSPTTEKKWILWEDRIWTLTPGWQTWRRHYLKRSSSSKSTSTPWWSGKRRIGKISSYHTPSIENGRCTKSQN